MRKKTIEKDIEKQVIEKKLQENPQIFRVISDKIRVFLFFFLDVFSMNKARSRYGMVVDSCVCHKHHEFLSHQQLMRLLHDKRCPET